MSMIDDDTMDDAGKPRRRRCSVYPTTTHADGPEHKSKVPVIRNPQEYRTVSNLGILFRPIPLS